MHFLTDEYLLDLESAKMCMSLRIRHECGVLDQIKPIDRILIERGIGYPCVTEGVFALHARPTATTVLFTSIVATPRLPIGHTESRLSIIKRDQMQFIAFSV